ncbi:MAG TPA: hypothetical protein VI636_19130 [Candidatus Angelobacter sp.]
MRTLFASSVVLFTIMCSLAFGIACGYLAVAIILRAFGHKSSRQESAPATAVIATTTASSH